MTPAQSQLLAALAAGEADVGVIHDISNDEYHRGPGMSCSQLKLLRRSPAHYWAINEGNATRAQNETNDAMFNGTLVHCALLEPDEYPKRYAVGREFQSRKAAGWRKFEGDFPDHVCVTDKEDRHAKGQAAGLRNLMDVADILRHGQAEVSAYWHDEATGLLCKCRPDWVSPIAFGAGVMLLDVKTTTDARPHAFARTVAQYGYHMQAAWYSRGWAAATGTKVYGMVLGVVESTFPFMARAYMLDEAAMALGLRECDAALAAYTECKLAGQWPGYPEVVEPLALPGWVWREAA